MKLWAIIHNDLRLIWKDRGMLAVLFLMPLAFILPISFALGGGNGYGIHSDNRRELLPVIRYDDGAHAQALVKTLAGSLQIEEIFSPAQIQDLGLQNDPACAQPGPACSEQIAVRLVAASRRPAALIIPAGFSASVDAGQHVMLTLYYDPAGDNPTRQLIEGVVRGAAAELSIQYQLKSGFDQLTALTAFAPKALQQEISTAQTTDNPQSAAFSIVAREPSNYRPVKYPDTYQQTIPGYTVMYVFFIIQYLTAVLKEERQQGTLKRMLGLPISRAELLGGKLLGALLICVLQVTLLLGVGVFLFGLNLGRDLPALLLLTLALAAAAVSLGLAAASGGMEAGVLTAPLIISALLGGCMFPIDLMPPFLRTISHLVPHFWALSAYQDLIVRGQGLVDILPDIGVLLLFAAVFFVIGVRRFEFEA